MGNYSGDSYYFKINPNAEGYDNLIKALEENYQKNDKEGAGGVEWSASFSIDKEGKGHSSLSGYKCRNTQLNSELMTLLYNNIRTDPDNCYLYNVNDNYTACALAGKAKYVEKLFKDCEKNLYDSSNTKYFEDCIQYPELIPNLIKNGEKLRLRNYLKDKSYSNYDAHCIFNNQFINIIDGKKKFNQLWMAYFLIYGTEDLLKAQINPIRNSFLNLKEILYAQDHEENPSQLGTYLLQLFTQYGVKFEPLIPSKNIVLGGKIGNSYTASAKQIDKWFEENKLEHTEYPNFSKETVLLLKEKFPATYEELREILKPQYEKKQIKGNNL